MEAAITKGKYHDYDAFRLLGSPDGKTPPEDLELNPHDSRPNLPRAKAVRYYDIARCKVS